MSHKTEQRKNAFKAKNIVHSSDRLRREAEQLRKDKRSSNLLAKRLKTDITVDPAQSSSHFSNDYVKDAISKIKGNDSFTRLDGLIVLRTILCSTADFTDYMIENDLPVFLSSILASPNEDIRIEAAWCLTNIATGDHKQTGSVLCAVPYMIEILSSSVAGATALRRDSVELLEQICWAIGNIAGDCDEYRNILINNGCLPAVLAFLESSVADSVRGLGAVKNVGTPVDERPSSAAQTAAWALSNLSRGKVSGHLFFDTGKVPFLLGLMNGQAKGLSEEVWWLFTFLTAKDDDVVNALLELGIVQRIGEALVACNGDSVSSIPLIRCAGNLSSGPDVWTDRLVADSRVLDALLVLTAYSGGAQWADQTASARKTVAKESLWVASNILGGSEAQRAHFVHHRSSDAKPSPILDNLLQCVHSDEFDLQQEAVRALEQACLDTSVLHLLASPAQLAGTVAPLARELERLLRVPSSDVPLCVARIVSAITDAHSKQCTVNGYVSGKFDLVHTWVDAGITEALDDIQYTGSSSGDRNSLGEVAAALVEQLYGLLEQEDAEDQTSLPAPAPVHHSASFDRGVPAVGSSHSLSHSPAPAPAAAQYSFAPAPSPTVFSFDAPSTPHNTIRSLADVRSSGSVGGGSSASNLAALGGVSVASSPFGQHHQQQHGQGQSHSHSQSQSPVPSDGLGARPAALGRGSHLSKPSWMN